MDLTLDYDPIWTELVVLTRNLMDKNVVSLSNAYDLAENQATFDEEEFNPEKYIFEESVTFLKRRNLENKEDYIYFTDFNAAHGTIFFRYWDFMTEVLFSKEETIYVNHCVLKIRYALERGETSFYLGIGKMVYHVKNGFVYDITAYLTELKESTSG